VLRKRVIIALAVALVAAGGSAVVMQKPALAQGNLSLAAPSGQMLATDETHLLVDIRQEVFISYNSRAGRPPGLFYHRDRPHSVLVRFVQDG
ncbi:MAG: hypothetical protein EA353_04975, partial [Puniceicoccaceae bacterium]